MKKSILFLATVILGAIGFWQGNQVFSSESTIDLFNMKIAMAQTEDGGTATVQCVDVPPGSESGPYQRRKCVPCTWTNVKLGHQSGTCTVSY